MFCICHKLQVKSNNAIINLLLAFEPVVLKTLAVSGCHDYTYLCSLKVYSPQIYSALQYSIPQVCLAP